VPHGNPVGRGRGRAGQAAPWFLSMLAATCLWLLIDPAFANKFETIGGGVSGSSRIKLEWLGGFLYAVGTVCLFGALLAVLMRNGNALLLNYSNWKTSAILLLLVGALAIGAGLLI
jgi:hypothetical protein